MIFIFSWGSSSLLSPTSNRIDLYQRSTSNRGFTIILNLFISFQVTNFVVFICVSVSEVSHISSAKWANIVTWFGILITANLLFFHLFRITEVYNSIPWWKIELVLAALWSFFYLTASIALAIEANNYEARGSSKVWYFREHRSQN